MDFCEQLCQYMNLAGITSSDLSKASGISLSQIGRYRNGKRTPKAGSAQLLHLAAALEELSAQNSAKLTGILDGLSATLKDKYDTKFFSQNLDHLLNALNIRNSQLAQGMRYDASYMSKIRHGDRCPSNMDIFVSKLSVYLLKTQRAKISDSTIPQLLGCAPETAFTSDGLFSALCQYLYSSIPTQYTETYDFLKALDSFSLEKHIQSIQFKESDSFPSVSLPASSQNYYGIDGLKEAELVFEQSTLLSESKTPIFMYSDMPMEPLADGIFPKQWMTGLAMILGKKIPIRIIHHLNRPFHEMMLGLTAWIPLYMTGHILPFYLDVPKDSPFRHMLYVSGSAALSGECIAGRDKHGKKYVTFDHEEITYYRQKANDLLKLSHPLMDIYRQENAEAFRSFLKKMHAQMAPRRNQLSSPSLGTLPMELLEEILDDARVNNMQKEMVRALVREERESYEAILPEHEITETVPAIEEAVYQETPLFLPIASLFANWQIPYSYAHYAAHLNAMREFAKTHAHYHLEETDSLHFLNIQIQTVCGEYVLVSKSDVPAIHFVIWHPLLVNAIEQFMVF